ncbi:glycosyltransferase family 8 protein [bacterium]|nr:glycosyltransferase family 8 protein [bacterium]
MINICFGLNDNFCEYCAAAIASILYNSNTKDDYHIYIISDFISEINKKKLNALKEIRKFKLTFLKFDVNEVKHLKDNGLGISTYFRYKMFDLIKDDKVLYLDCDIIVRCDIKELFDIDLEGNLAAGVEDIISIHQKEVTKLSPNSTYINAGVMLFDLKQCAREGINKKLKDFLKTSNGLTWHDQHTLNYILQERIKIVDMTYNHMYSYKNSYKDKDYYNSLKDSAKIIHFITDYKPWKAGCEPYRKEEYFKYIKLTPYYQDFMLKYLADENKILSDKLNKLEELIVKKPEN